MKLKEISIKNFKSISELSLNFSDNLYCLVGENESGKTNILQAINLLNENYNLDLDETKFNNLLSKASIKASFSAEDNDIRKISSAIPNISFGGINQSTQGLTGINVLVRKSVNQKNKIVLIINNKVEIIVDSLNDRIKTLLLEKLSEILPSIEYYEKEDFLLSPLNIETYLKDPHNPSFQSFKKLLQLGGISNFNSFNNLPIEDLIQIREMATEKINSILKKYYDSKYNLHIKIESHNNEFTLLFKDESNKINLLQDRSSGFQYFFSFLINKLYSLENAKKNTIFLLDEPALSLHPTNQKKFINLLEDLSKNSQTIYTTHSPFCINRLKPTRVWVVERNIKNGTFINPKPYQNNWRPVRFSLGIDISDSFFYANKTLLVEGPEDRIYIASLLNHFVSNGKISINSDLLSIIDSGSIDNMLAMIQILIDEKRPILVLMDNDVTRTYNKVKAKETQIGNLKTLRLLTISDIYKDAVSIEDLLPSDLYIKSIKNYLEYLENEGIIKLKNSEKRPTLKKVIGSKKYSYYATEILDLYETVEGEKLDSKTPISKVGIAHEFEKILNAEKQIKPEDELNCLKLISELSTNLDL